MIFFKSENRGSRLSGLPCIYQNMEGISEVVRTDGNQIKDTQNGRGDKCECKLHE